MGRGMGRGMRRGMLARLLLPAGAWVGVLASGWAGPPAHAGAGVRAERPAMVCRVRPAQPVLGHVVHWDIHARDLPPLPLVRAGQLGADWLLQGQAGEASSADGHSTQTLRLRLYPMSAGVLRLPELRAGRGVCASRTLRVLQARAGHRPLYMAARLRGHVREATVGQALRIELDVAAGGGLAWQAVSVHTDDGVVHALGTLDTRAAARGGIEVQRQSWSFTPTRAGEITLRFGLLRGTRLGKLLVVPVAPLRWRVRPLPAYWPPGAPVGHARLRVLPAPASLELGDAAVLRARLSGVQLGRGEWLRLLDAEARASGLRVGAPRLRRVFDAAQGPAPAWDIEWPVHARRAGRLRYPRLRLPYYDPERGAPGLALADWGTVRVRDPRPRRIALALLAVAGLVAALALLRQGVLFARCALCRFRWRRIARRGDARELRRLWRQARARGQAPAATLRAWVDAQRCGQRGVRSPELDQLLDREQERLYASPRTGPSRPEAGDAGR